MFIAISPALNQLPQAQAIGAYSREYLDDELSGLCIMDAGIALQSQIRLHFGIPLLRVACRDTSDPGFIVDYQSPTYLN